VKAVLISHFRNEEYLLPWWIEHHKDHFDQAILIDYHSTDRSREIIGDLAPSTWRIVPSGNQFFTASLVDEEVMKIESTVEGAKIALNTTEFLVGDLSGILGRILSNNAIKPWAASLIDTDPEQLPTYATPLLIQKNMGVASFHQVSQDKILPRVSKPIEFARAIIRDPLDALRGFRNRRLYSVWTPHNRRRILHSYSNGRYSVGRHSTQLDNVYETQNLGVVWLAGAPWNQMFMDRKHSVKELIPVEDRLRGYGIQHFIDQRQLNEVYKYYLRHALSLNTTSLS
jgi:hypothetical protein